MHSLKKARGLLAVLGVMCVTAVAAPAQVVTSAPPAPAMKAVLSELAMLGGKPIATLTPDEARLQPSPSDAVQRIIAQRGITPAILPVGDVTDTMFHANGADIPLRIYTPRGKGPFPVLVYYHGGGWVIADINTYDASCRELADGAKTIVVSVGYRQAPGNKFPAAANDAYEALLWTQANAPSFKGDTHRISVGGESAGGNLATVTAMMARDQHTAMPIHQLLIYPVANMNFSTPSYKANAMAKPLNLAMMKWFYRYYLRSPADGANPYVSPLRGSLAHLPPATVITAQIDPLMSDGKEYVEKLKAAGVPVTYRNYNGVTHEFFGMGAVVPQAKQAEAFASQQLRAANAP